ncbi:MAG: ribonuclease J [Myxococcaceae bacterium]
MLRIIPLGGLGEIGLNAMIFELGDEMLLVDAGLMFPRDVHAGVDIILPNFEYLQANAHKLKAVVLTHAHEDHLGALPYLLRDLPVPVFGTRFATELLRYKMQELDVETDVHEISPGEVINPSRNLRFEAVRMCHSLPDAVGILVNTPGGSAFHTGDWKLDDAPLDGWTTDLERLHRAGDEGLDVLLSDSTNAEVTAHTPSEQLVAQTFERLFRESPGRVIVSMFASHIGRMQAVMDLCAKTGRKLILSGRTMQRNMELAQRTVHLKVPPDVLVEMKDAGFFPPKFLALLASGSQAEPRSHLVQMSGDEFPLKFEPTDLVILSARAIPGNEQAIGDMIDRILAHGAKVAYWRTEPGVHVSGHASAVEQKKLITTVRPKNFVPIHGELRHLHAHLKNAREAGIADDSMLLARDGDVLKLDQGRLRLDGTVPVGRLFRDRDGIGTVAEEVLKEREKLAYAGVVIAVVVIDRATGKIVAGPQLQGRGVTDEEAHTLERGADEVRSMLEETSPVLRADDAYMKDELIRAIRRLFKLRNHKRPTVMPAIVKL